MNLKLDTCFYSVGKTTAPDSFIKTLSGGLAATTCGVWRLRSQLQSRLTLHNTGFMKNHILPSNPSLARG